jgi:hypothetical protein
VCGAVTETGKGGRQKDKESTGLRNKIRGLVADIIIYYIYLPTTIGLMPGGSVYIK